ncbi:hypothetical protein HAX54_036320 [Datura stramonium]|uniref:Uncharacterized protein n=1 Tax=Datura stramonium TaxID=4076 RepID=A0ABS8SFZ6_DATST|nr:hypothetical protein [Datura stramonium]
MRHWCLTREKWLTCEVWSEMEKMGRLRGSLDGAANGVIWSAVVLRETRGSCGYWCSGDGDGGEEEDEREWCIGRYGGGRRRWKKKEGNDDAMVHRCSQTSTLAVVHWTMGKKRGEMKG